MDLASFGLDDASEATLRFMIQRKVLLALLEKTAVVVPLKDIIPVLANFSIQAAKAIRVTTTNLEISMLCATRDVEVDVPGIAFFPVRRFLDIIKECPDSLVTITVVEQTAVISTGRTTWTLKLHSGIGYPPLPEISELQLKSIEKALFASTLRSVKYAAAKTPAKASMMMVNIAQEKATACDGIRLHQTLLRGFPLTLQIPIDAVDDILKLTDKHAHDTIMAGESENHLVFQVGSDILIINKLMLEFPDVSGLLGPALRNKDQLIVDCQELIDAVKRVRVNADIESPSVALELTRNTLLLKARDRYGQMAVSELSVEWPKLVKQTLVFNHRMLLEMLNAFESKVCNFYIGEDPKNKNKKLAVLLRDEQTGSLAVLQQMTSLSLEA